MIPPQVSVVLLSYNQAAYLPAALASIAAQHIPLHLIAVDDASTDGSPVILRQFSEASGLDVTLLLHPRNRGVSASLNDALEHARAPYVATLAADDYWLPNKLSRQLGVFERLSVEYGVLYGDALLCDEHGTIGEQRFIGHECRDLPKPRPSGWVFQELLNGNFVPAPSALMRRRCFEEVGTFDPTFVLEDYEFWLRLSQRYKFYYDDVITSVYRVHGGSVMRTRQVALRRDTLRILERYVPTSRGGERSRYLSDTAFFLYTEGEPEGVSYLVKSLKYRLNARAAVALPFAWLGFGGARVRWLKRRLGRWKRVMRKHRRAAHERCNHVV